MTIHQLSQLLSLKKHLLSSSLFLVSAGFLLASRVFLWWIDRLLCLLLSQLRNEICVIWDSLRPITLTNGLDFILELARLLKHSGVFAEGLDGVGAVRTRFCHGVFEFLTLFYFSFLVVFLLLPTALLLRPAHLSLLLDRLLLFFKHGLQCHLP